MKSRKALRRAAYGDTSEFEIQQAQNIPSEIQSDRAHHHRQNQHLLGHERLRLPALILRPLWLTNCCAMFLVDITDFGTWCRSGLRVSPSALLAIWRNKHASADAKQSPQDTAAEDAILPGIHSRRARRCPTHPQRTRPARSRGNPARTHRPQQPSRYRA
jgi:hypothetical protein